MAGHLAAQGITMHFDGVVANDEVHLEVRPGEIVGLIGPNGAGKTTLFNCVTGFLRPSAGTVRFNGQDVTRLRPAERASLGMARTFQQTRLFGHLTVRENLLLGRHLRLDAPAWKQALGLPSARRAEREANGHAERLAVEFGLSDILDARSQALPYGTGKLVAVARALAGDPDILLLDEPSAGMDSTESAHFSKVLAQGARQRDLSVLLIEHDMALVLGICDRVYVMDFGVLVAEGTPAEIRADERVRRAYLGTELDTGETVSVRG